MIEHDCYFLYLMFLMEPICQTQSIVELRFISVEIKQLRRLGRFYLLRVSTSKRSPKLSDWFHIWQVYCNCFILFINGASLLAIHVTRLVNFLILEQTFISERLFYRAIYVETWHSFTCFELRIVSMGFKNGRIPAVSKAHLLEFYGVRHLRDWNMAQFVSQCQ